MYFMTRIYIQAMRAHRLVAVEHTEQRPELLGAAPVQLHLQGRRRRRRRRRLLPRSLLRRRRHRRGERAAIRQRPLQLQQPRVRGHLLQPLRHLCDGGAGVEVCQRVLSAREVVLLAKDGRAEAGRCCQLSARCWLSVEREALVVGW
jgi:hypothetical protein